MPAPWAGAFQFSLSDYSRRTHRSPDLHRFRTGTCKRPSIRCRNPAPLYTQMDSASAASNASTACPKIDCHVPRSTLAPPKTASQVRFRRTPPSSQAQARLRLELPDSASLSRCLDDISGGAWRGNRLVVLAERLDVNRDCVFHIIADFLRRVASHHPHLNRPRLGGADSFQGHGMGFIVVLDEVGPVE